MARIRTVQVTTTVDDGPNDKGLVIERINGVATVRGLYYQQNGGIEIRGGAVGLTGTATWQAMTPAQRTTFRGHLDALWAERATADGFT